MVEIPDDLMNGDGDYFLLTVCGDSMQRAGIGDGSLAVVRRQNTAQNNDTVAVMLDGEARIMSYKVFRVGAPDESAWLQGADGSVAPVRYTGQAILGVVTGTMQKVHSSYPVAAVSSDG